MSIQKLVVKFDTVDTERGGGTFIQIAMILALVLMIALPSMKEVYNVEQELSDSLQNVSSSVALPKEVVLTAYSSNGEKIIPRTALFDDISPANDGSEDPILDLDLGKEGLFSYTETVNANFEGAEVYTVYAKRDRSEKTVKYLPEPIYGCRKLDGTIGAAEIDVNSCCQKLVDHILSLSFGDSARRAENRDSDPGPEETGSKFAYLAKVTAGESDPNCKNSKVSLLAVLPTKNQNSSRFLLPYKSNSALSLVP